MNTEQVNDKIGTVAEIVKLKLILDGMDKETAEKVKKLILDEQIGKK